MIGASGVIVSLRVVLVKLAVFVPLPTFMNRVIVLPFGRGQRGRQVGVVVVADVERDGQAGHGADVPLDRRSCRAR